MSKLQIIPVQAHTRLKIAPDPLPVKEPVLPESALYGPLGDVVKAIAPGTEADPAGILLHLLIGIGSVVGRDPHLKVESGQQRMNEFGLLVGKSAVSRKGTAAGWAKLVLDEVADPEWSADHNVSGLATPQGVLHKLRDDADPAHPFANDKRLFSLEEEFSAVLRACEDGGLSEALRKCWDSSRLEHMVKKDPMVVREPHVSIVGHMTRDEFHAKVTNLFLTNGLLNRFLIAYVDRAQDLPLGGMHLIDTDAYQDAVTRIAEAVAELRTAKGPLPPFVLAFDAEREWERVYGGLIQQANAGGAVGSMMARGATHVLRLSMIYAALDRRGSISLDNLRAALAMWDYCSASAAYLLSPVVQATVNGTKPTFSTKPRRLLDAITASKFQGVSRQEISKLFGNNEKAAQITAWLEDFESEGLVERATVQTGGRPAQRFYLAGYAPASTTAKTNERGNDGDPDPDEGSEGTKEGA